MQYRCSNSKYLSAHIAAIMLSSREVLFPVQTARGSRSCRRDVSALTELSLLGVSLLFRLQILGLCDPVEVPPQIFLQLLLLTELLEVAPSFRLLPLLGKLTVGGTDRRL